MNVVLVVSERRLHYDRRHYPAGNSYNLAVSNAVTTTPNFKNIKHTFTWAVVPLSGKRFFTLLFLHARAHAAAAPARAVMNSRLPCSESCPRYSQERGHAQLPPHFHIWQKADSLTAPQSVC